MYLKSQILKYLRFLFDFFLAFYAFNGEDSRRHDRKWGERVGGMTCSRGLQAGYKPMAAAEDSQPPYTGRMLDQPSYPGESKIVKVVSPFRSTRGLDDVCVI